MNVTILGAGNIGLGFVQRLYYEDSIAITVFSSKNIFENGILIIKDIENDRVAEINNIKVTNDARKSLEDADLILCTYPAFLRKEFLRKYQNYIKYLPKENLKLYIRDMGLLLVKKRLMMQLVKNFV